MNMNERTCIISETHKNVKNIRNVCFLAHVDHGKTSLADSLLASNDYISERLSGQIRFMDSHPDEMRRGITMKSSSVSLLVPTTKEMFVVNLMDSPGHVDFSHEVSTAVRLCDGAIIVIDVIEGIQSQTTVVLRQAWQEGIKSVLVLNKMDKLFTEKKMTTSEAYAKLLQILEGANAILGELFASSVLEEQKDSGCNDVGNGLCFSDDSAIYFSPSAGNVIFASASDGWAFDITMFSQIFASKLGVNPTKFKKALWGDYYLSTGGKVVSKGALASGKKPLFVSCILDNIWSLYDVILSQQNEEKLKKIISNLCLNTKIKHFFLDTKGTLRSIMSQWLPLSSTLFRMIIHGCPSPRELGSVRSLRLMSSKSQSFSTFPRETRDLKEDFQRCDSSGPLIIFVSKMFPFLKKNLPDYRGRNNDDDNSLVFIALARVYSGTVRVGNDVYVCGPKHDPKVISERIASGRSPLDETEKDQTNSIRPIMKTQIKSLYLLLGRDIASITEATPGNIIGIGGLDSLILKSGTISSSPFCPPFVEMSFSGIPILRVAVEPAVSSDLNALVKGLHLLNQADANVQVILTEKGEHLLVTSGEVHLEKCIADLTNTYAGIEIKVSEPIVPFRETIIAPPKVDMVQESILNDDTTDVIEVFSSDKQSTLRLKAVPLSQETVDLLLSHSHLLKALHSNDFSALSQDSSLIEFKDKLSLSLKDELQNSIEHILSFGPKNSGPNLLINSSSWCPNISLWTPTKLSEIHYSFINGFQLATLNGPICEEPMHGVAFVICDWIEGSVMSGGSIMSLFNSGCRSAFSARHVRLMAAMYSCDIIVKAAYLGKMYGVLNKRKGKIVKEDMIEGSSTFIVTATLPVIESFDFSNEMRKQTSGLAMPQLVFSHWELLDCDPYWVPLTEEELLHFGDKADSENVARMYMNEIRKKKGLPVDEKIIEFGEKQRTISKKK